MAFWRGFGSFLRGTGKIIDELGQGMQHSWAVKETLNKAQAVMPYAGKAPALAENVFVAQNATVVGDVKLGAQSSVWYGAVIRGDVNSVTIGPMTNVQDNAVIHVAQHNPDGKPAPTTIGAGVTIGHGAVIHAASIGDGAVVGMGATVMDGARVEAGAIVAAGALVVPDTVVPAGQIWAGSPARFLRNLTEGEAQFLSVAADSYAQLAAVHAEEAAKSFAEVELDKARRADRRIRDPDYDQQHGVERDPLTREVISVAAST